MDNSYQIKSIIDSFRNVFEGLELFHQIIQFEKGLSHSFFVKNMDAELLKNNWIKISNFIAINFQNKLENEFERWNIYLFFLMQNKVSNEVKYQIENDTFSSRKIVIVGENNYDKIINEHIINNNLTLINKETPEEVEFKPNPIIWDILEGKTLKKIKRTSEAEPSLDKIIEKLKQQENEI